MGQTRSPIACVAGGFFTGFYMAMLCCLRSSFGPQKQKLESSTCTLKNLSDNENINLKKPSFLWQGNLPNRTGKIKRLLACHDIHLPRASGQVLSITPLFRTTQKVAEQQLLFVYSCMTPNNKIFSQFKCMLLYKLVEGRSSYRGCLSYANDEYKRHI